MTDPTPPAQPDVEQPDTEHLWAVHHALEALMGALGSGDEAAVAEARQALAELLGT